MRVEAGGTVKIKKIDMKMVVNDVNDITEKQVTDAVNKYKQDRELDIELKTEMKGADINLLGDFCTKFKGQILFIIIVLIILKMLDGFDSDSCCNITKIYKSITTSL